MGEARLAGRCINFCLSLMELQSKLKADFSGGILRSTGEVEIIGVCVILGMDAAFRPTGSFYPRYEMVRPALFFVSLGVNLHFRK